MESATTLSSGVEHRARDPLHSRPMLVLDTNTVLDLWGFRDPGVQPLRLDLESGRVHWWAITAMRAELEHVLGRGVGCRQPGQAAEVLAQWDRHAQVVTMAQGQQGPAAGPSLQCRDADDQMFLDLAFMKGATWLLSSDRDLLSLKRRALKRGLRIARPQECPTV